ncbi:MAG TPA: type III-B CRISPR module-associated protein Cmr3 [Bacteroidetes bacterium]|nr:type III-B CRISPR module-associated protein Cmr3 [Bacteroidota bacterium]
MNWIKFDATDTWFFRDGRPFNAGEESWANSLFPPYPSVLYGVMRTVFFANNMPELSKANTAGDPSARLRIIHYGLCFNDVGLSFPLPADLIRKKGENNLQPLQLKTRPPSLVSSYEKHYTHILQSPFPDKSDNLFGQSALSLPEFCQYLLGQMPSNAIEFKDYSSPEYKVGLGRNRDTRQAEEGMLYKVTYRRPTGLVKNMKNPTRSVSLSVAIDGLSLSDNGLTKFGADGKLAVFSKLEPTPEMPAAPIIGKGEIFKMYLATPAIFKEGWAPLALFKKYGLKICTAAIGKPLSIGGWDMQNKRPKPMRKALPAGSVYYLQEVESGNAQGFVNAFHAKALQCVDSLGHQGFGIAFFGKTKQS